MYIYTKNNISASTWLIIEVNFTEEYLTSLRSYMNKYEERTGTNAVITDTGSQIINNQNNNTQEIINNINEANENLLNGLNEQNQVCKIIDKSYILENNKVLGNDGTLISTDVNIGVTDYIPITQNNNLYKIIQNIDFSNRLCFANSLKENISCIQASSVGLGKITIPNGTEYVRFTIINDSRNAPQYRVCENGNQAVNDSVNDLIHQINDDDTERALNGYKDFFNLF